MAFGPEGNWYAVQLSSDALQTVRRYVGWQGPKGGSYVAPTNKGQLRVVLGCQEAEIDLYLPWERRKITHHRSKRILERDFPLFPGYAFVRNVINPFSVSEVEGINCVMVNEMTGVPEIIPENKMHELFWAELEYFLGYQGYSYRARLKAKEAPLRKELAELHPTGTPMEVKNEWLKDQKLRVEGVTGRNAIRTTAKMFGRLVKAEITSDFVEQKNLA